MKKLIIICILYSSSLLGMDSSFKIPHLLDQLTGPDIEILENIVHKEATTPKGQNEELNNTLVHIKKIQAMRKEQLYENLLDYANQFVQNPHSISFIRTIIETLEQSNDHEAISDAWNTKGRTLLKDTQRIQEVASENVQLIHSTTASYLEARSEPRLRHILTYAEEIAERAAENHKLLVTFQKHIDSLADDTP